MDDRVLLLMACVVSALGVFALLLMPMGKNEDFSLAKIDEGALLKGEVIGVQRGEQFTKIRITYEVLVIVFDDLDVDIGDSLEIEGDVQVYKGERELIAKRVKKLK